MPKDSRKKTLCGQLALALLMTSIGLFLTGRFAAYASFAISGYAGLETLKPDEISSRVLVDVSVTDNFDWYLEYTTQYTVTNVSRQSRCYVIQTGGGTAADWHYLSIQVPSACYPQMDKMADASAEGYSSSPVTFSGEIRELSEEELAAFRQVFLDAGWVDDEIAARTLPYCIDAFRSKTNMNILYIGSCALGLLLSVIGLFRIMSFFLYILCSIPGKRCRPRR